MVQYFIENDLISHNQSKLKPWYSCINQLQSFTHEIYKSVDEGYETRGVFLDISKIFGKICHEGLLHKRNENGLPGNLLNIATDVLYQWKQRVFVNGQYSSWAAIETGVPQGSILGPLFFLIYINELSNDLASNPKLFAVDISLFPVVKNMTKSLSDLNNDLAKISSWASQSN